MMTLGSLFDGIGGWQLAAEHAGVKPIWSSEIERFPIEVTKRRFPDTIQLGDITKLDGATIPPVDIICAGSPCQDLSIAGKQKGLAGERSGLFKNAIDIVRSMRRATAGIFPRFFVWENVPGAFSSNHGFDFRSVLEEIGQTEIPMPAGGKWANAGMVECDECQIAWRMLDAQYWGVPQRRKRIFLVADFAKSGRCAGEVLFEPESLSGDSAESGGKRKGTAAETAGGSRSTGGGGTAVHPVNLQIATRHIALGRGTGFGIGNDGDPAYTLEAEHSHGVAIYDMTHADEVMRPVKGDKCQTLNHRMGTGGNQVPVVSYSVDSPICFEPGSATRTGGHVYDDGKAPTLRAAMGDNIPAISYAIAGNTIDRQIQNGGNGKGVIEEVSYTLNTIDRHAVYVGNQEKAQRLANGKPVTGTLMASCGTKQWLGNQEAFTDEYHIITNKTIRRLTPAECERLQGLQDGYTLIDDKICSDSARYKALGNGMAQPCADYIIMRIVQCIGRTNKTS